VIHTLFLVREENAALSKSSPSLSNMDRGLIFHHRAGCVTSEILRLNVRNVHPLHDRHFLLIREIYLTITLQNALRQKGAVGYPLAALPELLAVLLFAVPDLVPDKRYLVAYIRVF
jgi:hypothetical protein